MKMAKRVTAEKPAAKAETSTVKAISGKDFDSVVKRCRAAQSAMDSERGSLGSIISDAVENKHLHKGAFGVFRRLDKMDAGKRAELLFNFDLYRERAEKRTGPDAWGAQPDMLPDRVDDAEEPGESGEETERDPHPGVRGDQLAGFPDDDKQDLRPRYLREGSAADPDPDVKH
jgi:hypothetical protein